MKILAISDEEVSAYWEHYVPGRLDEFDLILSCGDLNASYLSFLVTMAHGPVMYIHGNHDIGYGLHPPEGCDCIEDKLVTYRGLRILGLGGCVKYRPGPHQYTDDQMRRRIARLKRQLRKAGGVDIVITHAPPKGVGDADDAAHRGFRALLELIDEYHPQYLLHGHIHARYGFGIPREQEYHGTRVINVSERYILDLPEKTTDRISGENHQKTGRML